MSFTAMPPIPQAGITPEMLAMFSATKQNLEQLIGQSGEIKYSAMLRGAVTFNFTNELISSAPALSGQGFSIAGGGTVPSLSDFTALTKTVADLQADVKRLQESLNALATHAKG